MDDNDPTMKLPDPDATPEAMPSAGELLARALRTGTFPGAAGGWTPPTPEELAELLPQYRIESLLGHGGMGAVYKGTQVALDRAVAIKLLPLEVSSDPAFAKRFKQEARTLAKLSHPNIVAVHDFGTTSEGHLYFVMEFVEGTDLHKMIHGPGLSPAQALSIIIAICEALQYAHGKGVVHRDIKPANVMVNTEGTVKVADFGLARLNTPNTDSGGLTMTGTVMGTPAYMAPEQTRGMNVDHRADIYSLGVMLYEMLCGEIPRGVFDPPSHKVQVDIRLDEVVLKAMHSAPERRYQNTVEMKTDVDRIRTTPEQRKPAPKPKSKSRVASIIAVCLTLVTAASFGIWKKMQHARAEQNTPAVVSAPSNLPIPAPLRPTLPGSSESPVKQTPASAGATPTAPALPASDPAARAVRFGKSRYLVVTEQCSWPDAKLRAERMGGHLATITSPEEQQWMGENLLRGSVYCCWIGAIKASDGQWRWVTDEPFKFTAWETPNLPDPKPERKYAYFRRIEPHVDGKARAKWCNRDETGEDVAGPPARNFYPWFIVEWDDAGGTISTPAAATKDAPFINTLGMKFVPVPITGGPTGGQRVLFSIWQTRVQDYAAYGAANPTADGSWKTESRDGVPVGSDPDRPVVNVSWEDAQAFCQWLTAKETAAGKLPQGMKYRLPSDEEWSWAVGLPPESGATPAEKHAKNSVDFPWGKEWPPTMKVGNYADESFHAKFPLDENAKEGYKNQWMEGYTDGYATTSPVGSFPANAYGLYDMGGNVWQWCEDWFDASCADRVGRGAAWPYFSRSLLLSSARNNRGPGVRQYHTGFRCVLGPATPAPGATSPPSQALWKKIPLTPEQTAQAAKNDGWITQERWYLSVTATDHKFKDGAVRLRYRWEKDAVIALNLRRQQNDRRVGVRFLQDGQLILENWLGNGEPKSRQVKETRQFTRPVSGSEGTIEIAVIGNKSFARLNGVTISVSPLPDDLGGGTFDFGNGYGDRMAAVKDVEYLNLDGVPNAEAVLGWGIPAAVSSTAPATATKDAPFVNTLGMKFVPVPITGGPTGGQRVLFSVWDARVQDYAAFVKEEWRERPKPDFEQGPTHPAVSVSWEDAQAFCLWLTVHERRADRLGTDQVYRLPTDHEWSCAVGIGEREEAAKTPEEKSGKINDTYPWGKQWPPPPDAGNYGGEELKVLLAAGKHGYILGGEGGWRDAYPETAPVGSFAPNIFGLYDLSGNAFEWCEDWFNKEQKDRVLRGASWSNYSRAALLSAHRHHGTPTTRHTLYGFRVVLAPAAP